MAPYRARARGGGSARQHRDADRRHRLAEPRLPPRLSPRLPPCLGGGGRAVPVESAVLGGRAVRVALGECEDDVRERVEDEADRDHRDERLDGPHALQPQAR